MKLNLSRAASKMEPAEPQQSTPSKPIKKAATPKPPEPPPAEPAQEHVAPTVEPAGGTVAAEAPAPAVKKAWPVKSKRPRFVRAKAEKRDRRAAAPLPAPSTNVFARLMTKNLALPPKADGPALPR